jgi:hypothetical protein
MDNFGIWFAAVGVILTNFGSAVGILKYFNSRFAKMYDDLDKYKEKADQDYVRKDLCKIMHEQSAINIIGLETRINIRLDKQDERQEKILELLTKK